MKVDSQRRAIRQEQVPPLLSTHQRAGFYREGSPMLCWSSHGRKEACTAKSPSSFKAIAAHIPDLLRLSGSVTFAVADLPFFFFFN